MKEQSWKLQGDGSWLLALGRERRMLRNVPAGWKHLDVPWHASWTSEFCASEFNNPWNLTNGKLFLRSEQESKARETACSFTIQEACLSPFSWNIPPPSMLWSTVWIQQGESYILLKRAPHRLVDPHQSTRDVQSPEHKRNEKTTTKSQHQQSNFQKRNNKDIHTSEGSFPGSTELSLHVMTAK